MRYLFSVWLLAANVFASPPQELDPHKIWMNFKDFSNIVKAESLKLKLAGKVPEVKPDLARFTEVNRDELERQGLSESTAQDVLDYFTQEFLPAEYPHSSESNMERVIETVRGSIGFRIPEPLERGFFMGAVWADQTEVGQKAIAIAEKFGLEVQGSRIAVIQIAEEEFNARVVNATPQKDSPHTEVDVSFSVELIDGQNIEVTVPMVATYFAELMNAVDRKVYGSENFILVGTDFYNQSEAIQIGVFVEEISHLSDDQNPRWHSATETGYYHAEQAYYSQTLDLAELEADFDACKDIGEYRRYRDSLAKNFAFVPQEGEEGFTEEDWLQLATEVIETNFFKEARNMIPYYKSQVELRGKFFQTRALLEVSPELSEADFLTLVRNKSGKLILQTGSNEYAMVEAPYGKYHEKHYRELYRAESPRVNIFYQVFEDIRQRSGLQPRDAAHITSYLLAQGQSVDQVRRVIAEAFQEIPQEEIETGVESYRRRTQIIDSLERVLNKK